MNALNILNATYDSDDELENELREVHFRIIPDRENPMEIFSDVEFHQRYRFRKEIVTNRILPLVLPNLQKTNNRGMPLPPVLQVLTVLRFYATGCFQTVSSDLHGVSQPTVSRLVRNISRYLAEHVGAFIQFSDLMELQRKFYQIARFPGVIGCIDGTHIRIQCPSRDQGELFRNRKGWYSINVQVVGGPDQKILDLLNRWPGRVHDSRIFNNSALKMKFENDELRGILLGDSGYPQLRYLFTPFLNPAPGAQTRYNTAQIRTRNKVETLFGVWKRRFPCLQKGLGVELPTILNIITATAILHNIALEVRDDLEGVNEPLNENQPAVDVVVANANLGSIIRNNFANTHFN